MPPKPITLKQVIEDNDSYYGRVFDYFIQLLIFVSIVSFSMETLPDLTLETRRVLRWVEILTVAVFTAEYLSRIWVADSKKRFVFSFFGIIDLLAILPFYIAIGVDLRSLRIFRFLRLLRIIKVFRYNSAIERFQSAFREIKDELSLFFLVTIFTLYIAAVGIYYFENPIQPEAFSSVFDAFGGQLQL